MVPVAVLAVVNRPLTVLIVTLVPFPPGAAVVDLAFLTENVPLGETSIVPTSLFIWGLVHGSPGPPSPRQPSPAHLNPRNCLPLADTLKLTGGLKPRYAPVERKPLYVLPAIG